MVICMLSCKTIRDGAGKFVQRVRKVLDLGILATFLSFQVLVCLFAQLSPEKADKV